MSETAPPVLPIPAADDAVELLPPQPTLRTARLVLRPLATADAPAVQRFCSDRAVAENTLSIPHPYPDGAAGQFIVMAHGRWAIGESGVWAVVPRGAAELAGTIGLVFAREHRRAELGYWIGRPHWNRGYATEAARALTAWALETLGLERVVAHHFTRNPASGAVLRKAGMRHEGSLRKHILKWGVLEDLEMYGILRGEGAEGQGGRGSAPDSRKE
jgi:RimJ/RimL family protein N-acetyltransferase